MAIKRTYKLSDVCFYVFWFLLQIGKGLGHVSSDIQFTVLVLMGFPFAIARVMLLKWESHDFYKMVALNLLGGAITFVSGNTTYLLSIFCITAVKGMDIKKLLKVTLFVRSPLFILRTTLAICGFADMEMRYRFADGGISMYRYALGYDHPNTAQFELFVMIMLVFILYSERMRLYHFVIAAGYSMFIFGYTNSKTSFALTLVFLCGSFLVIGKQREKQKKLLYFWSPKSWPVSVICSFFGCWGYVNIPNFHKLGTFASRFQTAVGIMRTRDLALFGTQGITTDLGLVYLIYDGGLLLTVLFFFGVYRLMKSEMMRNEPVLLWAFVCLAVFNIMEAATYSVLSNGLLLFLAYIVYPKRMPVFYKEKQHG